MKKLNSFLMFAALTTGGSAVTLANMRGIRSCSSLRLGPRSGQTAVEYLLTTLTLVTAFAGLYGFLQGQLKRLFTAAAIRILTSYY